MLDKSNGAPTEEWVRSPGPTESIWIRMAKAVYNPDDKSFCGRTAKRWGIVFMFYLVFYAVLSALFAICMKALLLSLDEDRPKYVLEQSFFGRSAKVTVRPGEEIVYNLTRPEEYGLYVSELNNSLGPYLKKFQPSECNEEDAFGYPNKPCFFIKLNKAFDWEPQCYGGDETQLPEEAPDDLKEYVRDYTGNEGSQVWISCLQESGNDTLIEYPSGQGFPAKHFPFHNQEGYVSPLVVVRFAVPDDTQSTTVVKCRAWAKNIVYDGSMEQASGYVRITLKTTL